VTFAADLAVANLAGQWITAAATDPNGETSEFSLDVEATAAPNQSLQQYLQASLPQSATTANSMTIQASANTPPATVIAAVNGLINVTQPVTVILDLGGGTYSNGGVAANPPANVSFVVQNGTLDPSYPALTVAGGQVSVQNCTLIATGDAPTILVTGGSLTLRNDTVQGTTGFSDPVIAVTAGTVDLGTPAQPGGNTINLNGTGQFVQNSTPNPIPATGNSFDVQGTPLPAPSLSFTRLAASTATTIPGQVVTFTATVRANGSGLGTPSGSVDFEDTTTNTDLGSVPLTGGVATLSTSALALGTHVIRASYSGDSGFLPSLDSLTQTVTQSVFVLNGTANGALSVSGNATITIPGTLVVDSTSNTALTASGNSRLTAAVIQVVGGVQKSGNAILTGPLTTGMSVVTDPLAGLSGPGIAGLHNYGSVSYSGSGSYPLQPGIYAQISASGSAKLTLSPGLYLIEGAASPSPAMPASPARA
jgi:hypothetical protein